MKNNVNCHIKTNKDVYCHIYMQFHLLVHLGRVFMLLLLLLLFKTHAHTLKHTIPFVFYFSAFSGACVFEKAYVLSFKV